MIRYLPAFLLLLVSGLAYGHHSTLGFFDPEDTIELEGTLTNVSWRNPHIHFDIEVTDAAGETTEWKAEASALSVLKTRGLHQEFMNVGDHIKVFGNPSRGDDPQMWATTVLLANGTEVLVALRATPHFTADTTGDQMLTPVFSSETEEVARREADGIFRVWSTVLGDTDSFPMFKGGYPLTEKAAQIKADWNPAADQLLSCWKKGMPILMITPVALEFTHSGDDILIRFEEDDAERLIHMNDNSAPDNSYSFFGYSSGKWEGNTLVVETTNINAPEFDDRGTPQTTNISMVERFTLSEDQQRLDYKISFNDPETFTEPFDLNRYWVWRPEIKVEPWDCEAQVDAATQ